MTPRCEREFHCGTVWLDTDYYLRLTAESYPHITARLQQVIGDVVPPVTAGACDGD